MEDQYSSILEVCNCSPIILSGHHNRNIVPFIPRRVHDNGRFIDHSLDSDGTIISPKSLPDYLCPIRIPETLQHDPTPCVQCCQILSPPPFESPPGSPEDLGFDHQSDIHSFDLNDASYTEPNQYDNGDSEALWLSQLKSMARLEGFFDDAVSVVTRFRFSRYKLSMLPSLFNSKKKPFGSSRKPRKKFRPSISDSEEEEEEEEEDAHCGSVGLGGTSLKEVFFKETVGFTVDVAGSSSATKNSAAEIRKSKGVCLSIGANNRAPGHHKIASPTSKAAINPAISGATGFGRSLC